MLKVRDSVYGAFMFGFSTGRNWANGVNRASDGLYGTGIPPGYPAQGSSKPPGGLCTCTWNPHGGALAPEPNWRDLVKSLATPNEVRIDVLPSPLGSHARPRRGLETL